MWLSASGFKRVAVALKLGPVRALRLLLILSTLILSSSTFAAAQSFNDWLAAFKVEAAAKGISQSTISSAFQDVQPIDRVLELDRRQPEHFRTFWQYLNGAISDKRIHRAQELAAQHRDLLAEVQRRYGVQPRFLLAFWALESNFGDHTGGFNVIAALATLAHDTRRSAFFREQLLQALKILDGGHIAAGAMTGSWAGAMGQLQFIPSTFTGFAVDADGDGRRDIWQSLPDIFASAANYLASEGWNGRQTWGREVHLPADFNWELAGLAEKKKLREWQAIGVRRFGGGNLPAEDMEASVIVPSGHKGPAFLVYRNFRTTLIWNRSILYAVAIGHLADRIAGQPALQSPRPLEERALSRQEVEEFQRLLGQLGYDAGEPDGLVGSRTRGALRAFQKSQGLPADGHPSSDVLAVLRNAASS